MKLRRTLILILSLALAVTGTALLACCADNNSDPPEHTTHVDVDPKDGKCDVCGDPMPAEGEEGEDPVQKMDFTVHLFRSGNEPISGATVVAFNEKNQMAAYAATNAQGTAVLNAPRGTYTVRLSVLIDGYQAEEGYTMSEEEPEITIHLSASLITTPMTNSQRYTLGDVMHDFSFTDSMGNASSLSALLQTKKAVLLNFWFINCTWCIREFPGMISAYNRFRDDIEIVGLDFTDATASVETFRQENGMPFPLVGNENACCAALASAFGVTGCPTSVLIDREGVICFIATGAGDEDSFLSVFEKYTAEPYVQDIMYPEEQQEQQRPNVEAPSSSEIEAAVNNTATGFDASYYFVPEGEEASHEYNWPWVVGEDGDGKYIKPSNSGYNGSYSMLYSDVEIGAGKAIAFDYKASCEENADMLYVFVDNVQLFAISGVNTAWKTLYAYVPLQSGSYRLCLAYVKDSSQKAGEDTVYIRNMRFVDTASIDEPTEMLYRCATGDIVNGRYSKYVSTVYSEHDGYYHVGTEDGPLVLANLMSSTNWSNENAYSYVQNGGFLYDLDNDKTAEDLTNRFIDFCQYANNSALYGYVAVTEEIKAYLDAFTARYGEKHHENEWLELCSYYVRYGFPEGTGQLADPARGLTDYNAIPAVENTQSEDKPDARNHVVIDRILVPRGVWFKFVPQTTGVYRVRSLGDYDTYGWIRDETLSLIMENDEPAGGFDPDDIAGSDGNFCMTLLMQAGKPYYIACAFFGIEDLGAYDFIITKLAASGDFWMSASANEYTWEIMTDENGDPMYDASGELLLGDIILRNAISIGLDDKGVYHALDEDGNLGGKVYINLASDFPTSMFPDMKIADMVDVNVYYCPTCGHTETGSRPLSCNVCGADEAYGVHKAFELPTPLYNEDGSVKTTRYPFGDVSIEIPEYERDDNGDLLFHDYTDVIKQYIAKSTTDYPTVDGDHFGYTEATEELVGILTKFILFGDYAMTPNVPNAWLLLASYYLHLGE